MVGVLGIEPRGLLAPVKNLSTPPLIIIQLLKKKINGKAFKTWKEIMVCNGKGKPRIDSIKSSTGHQTVQILKGNETGVDMCP